MLAMFVKESKFVSFCTRTCIFLHWCFLSFHKAMDLFDMGEGYDSLQDGLTRVKCPVMVIGVQTDILFPIWQQRTLAELLQKSGKGSNFQ